MNKLEETFKKFADYEEGIVLNLDDFKQAANELLDLQIEEYKEQLMDTAYFRDDVVDLLLNSKLKFD